MLSRVMLLWLLFVVAVVAVCPLPLASEEQCLTDAWRAWNSNGYDKAMKAAKTCVEKFSPDATRREKSLKGRTVSCDIHSDADKGRLFRQGVLNDVAAAWFIEGQAAEAKAGEGSSAEMRETYRKMAIKAYEEASAYKHACVWDPKGYFWSPATAAADRLSSLGAGDASARPQ